MLKKKIVQGNCIQLKNFVTLISLPLLSNDITQNLLFSLTQQRWLQRNSPNILAWTEMATLDLCTKADWLNAI